MSKTNSLSDSSSYRDATSGKDLQEAIRKRAEEIYVRNGRVPGRDLENWAEAEQEILQEVASDRRTAVIVDVNGMQYVGEYDANSCDGYVPGEFESGDPVPVRIDGEQMFLKRPNGRELATTIVVRNG